MKPQDNLEFLNKIDDKINKVYQEKRTLTLEIGKLSNKLQDVDKNLEILLRQKRVFGKTQYGSPYVREILIQAGIESDDLTARLTAYELEQRGLAEDRDDEITDEVISGMILLDNHYRLKNENFVDPLMGLKKCQDNNEIGDNSNDN